jgi:hypothetical protein
MLYLLRREGAEDNTKRLRKSPLVSERKEEDGDEENKQLCVNIENTNGKVRVVVVGIVEVIVEGFEFYICVHTLIFLS